MQTRSLVNEQTPLLRLRYKSHSYCLSIPCMRVYSFQICYFRHYADLPVINCRTELYRKTTDYNVGYFTDRISPAKKSRPLGERFPIIGLLFPRSTFAASHNAAYRDVARSHIVLRSERAEKRETREKPPSKKKKAAKRAKMTYRRRVQ